MIAGYRIRLRYRNYRGDICAVLESARTI